MREDNPLLINNDTHAGKTTISKSFLLILSLFVVLLAGSTITLGILYSKSSQSGHTDKIYQVTTGDAKLMQQQFAPLAGLKIGLITNPTAIVDNEHIIDWMFFTPNDINMSLVALFGPEHGLRGSEPAGASVNNSIDERTGLPIYSLYGAIRSPTPEMLENVTALVYDIQDVGARFYTYISTLGLCMQAAANHSIPFFVLDRPNPLGNAASGWVLNPSNSSFIGEYAIPVQYGLTVGELAQMIKGQNLLPGLENLTLNIITMDGYHSDLLWSETQLPWISPSPNIVDLDTAILYPGTGFFEAFMGATEGRGTLTPFKTIGAPWINATALAAQMQEYNLPGVTFSPTQFVPVNISDMSGVPKFLGEQVYGVRIDVTDRSAVRAVELGVYLVCTFYQMASNTTRVGLIDPDLLALHAGNDGFYDSIISGTPPQQIISQWNSAIQLFQQSRKSYSLYSSKN